MNTPVSDSRHITPWALRGLFAVAAIWLVKQAQPLLAPVVIAVVLTFVLAPAVRGLRRRGLPEVFGAAIVVVALLGGTALAATALAEPATLWWQRAPDTVALLLSKLDRLRASIPGLRAPTPAAVPAAPLPRPPQPASQAQPPVEPPSPPAAADPVKDQITTAGMALTAALLGRGASFTLSAVSTVLLLFFLLASEHWMLSRTVEAIPSRRTRALVLGGVRAAQREIGHYLFALACINSVTGIATGLAVHWLGLPNAVLWGALAATLTFVPYIGPLVMMGLLLLAGVVSFDGFAAIVAPPLAFLAVHAIETNLVSPWAVSRRLALSAISVFLSVMFWGWMWGIAGAMVAVPLLIGLRSACRRNRRLRLVAVYLEGDHKPPPSLRSLLRVRRPPLPHSAAGVRRGRR